MPALPAAAFAELSTGNVSDALDHLGIPGQCAGIRPLDRGYRLLGWAFTVRYLPIGAGSSTVGDYIDEVGDEQVVALDNQGRLDCTVWGDLLTSTALQRGIRGTVIDGVCRDSQRGIDEGYPMFSRGTWMRTGKGRVCMADYGRTVTIGGVQVRPGDLFFGDADGVVVIPAESVDQVAEYAHFVRRAEEGILGAVRAGRGLAAARAEFGYHDLQQTR